MLYNVFDFLSFKTDEPIRKGMSRMGQMKIAPDEIRGKRRFVSIISPNGTTEKIAAFLILIRPFRTFIS